MGLARERRMRTLATALTWRNGRRVRLRTVWGNPWRFDSSREQYHYSVLKIVPGGQSIHI